MSVEQEVLEAANWVMQASRRDDDVKLGITSACAGRGHDGPAEFAEADPEGFLAIVAALKDMTEQVPVEETMWLDGRSLTIAEDNKPGGY